MVDTDAEPALIARLESIVGERGLLTGQGRGAVLRGLACALPRPDPCGGSPGQRGTAELAAVVRLCVERRVGMVPQGGNTSRVGGAVPSRTAAQLVISLARMNRVREVDPLDMTMVVEAGAPWKTTQDAAAAQGCMLPLSISSEGTAQVGGILSTNAGGNNTLRYGNARELCSGSRRSCLTDRSLNALRRLAQRQYGLRAAPPSGGGGGYAWA